MPAISRVVRCGVQAAVLAATFGHLSAPLAAFAAPIPVPAPTAAHLADYASRPPAQSSTAALPQSQQFSDDPSGKDAAVVDHTASSAPPIGRRQDVTTPTAGLEQQLSLLQSSSAANGLLAPLLQPLIDAVTNFLNSLKPTSAALAIGPAGEKGLKYYNDDALEAAIKNLVNQLKDTLDKLVAMFNTGPLSNLGLGDLGQLLYVIKCLVIEALDASENLVDDVLTKDAITALQDLLQELQGVSATGTTVVPCKQGFIVGYLFCV